MLNKENRLHFKRDFKEVFNKGKVYKTDFFSIYFKPNISEKIRAAVIVKKKYFVKAVIRNYHKRIIKYLIVRYLREYKYDFVFVVNRSSGLYEDYCKSIVTFSDYLKQH